VPGAAVLLGRFRCSRCQSASRVKGYWQVRVNDAFRRPNNDTEMTAERMQYSTIAVDRRPVRPLYHRPTYYEANV